MDSFWHLHPQRGGGDTFTQSLPAMPPGHYQIFADVVLSSGFPVTMLGQIDLPSAIAGTPLIGDDSGIAAAPILTKRLPPPASARILPFPTAATWFGSAISSLSAPAFRSRFVFMSPILRKSRPRISNLTWE